MSRKQNKPRKKKQKTKAIRFRIAQNFLIAKNVHENAAYSACTRTVNQCNIVPGERCCTIQSGKSSTQMNCLRWSKCISGELRNPWSFANAKFTFFLLIFFFVLLVVFVDSFPVLLHSAIVFVWHLPPVQLTPSNRLCFYSIRYRSRLCLTVFIPFFFKF